MQLCHRIVEPLLHSFHVGGVVLFGGAQGGVAEEQLDGAEIFAGEEQSYGEGVAEAVRVAVGDAGEFGDAGDGAAGGAYGGRELGGTGPEEVACGGFGKRGEGFENHGGQANVERRAGFHHADEQTAGAEVERGALKFDGVADAESGIEQQQYQCFGAQAGAGDFALVGIVDAVAGGEQLADLGGVEGEGREWIVLGELEGGGVVLWRPLAEQAEAEEGAEVAEFLGLGTGGDGAAAAEAGELLDVDRGDAVGGGESRQVFQESFVAGDGAGGEAADAAVSEVGLDGVGKGRSFRDGGRRGFVGAALDAVELLLGVAPVAGLQGAALAVAVGIVAVHPYWAGAAGVADAFIAVGAGFFVAPVEAEHCASLAETGTFCGTDFWSSAKLMIL